jgi:iron complex transport system substrate-binding protein
LKINYTLMIACSFLPAATRMIYDMGLQDLLHGVTFECPAESAGKPVVVRCLLEGHTYSSGEIDRIFSASKAQGKSLYYVEEELLQGIAPDIIFTQDVCEVCQIDTACTEKAVSRLAKEPSLITLTPANLEQVFQTAVTIARALGREEAAYHHLSGLQKRIDTIIDTLRKHRAPLKRTLMMEWTEPVYNCGHWIPYQIACAGGIDMLSNPGGDSMVTPWDKIVRYDPEVVVIAPCGFHTDRALEDLPLLLRKPGWDQLQAVRDRAVFFADYDLFTQPSPATLTDGIELLAALFHPGIFSVPPGLQHKYLPAIQTFVHTG